MEWENYGNRKVDLSKFIHKNKIAHVSIEDEGLGKPSPAKNVKRVCDDEQIGGMNVNDEFEKMLAAGVGGVDTDQDA